MTPQVSDELRIEGAKYARMLDALMTERLNQVQLVALIVGLLAAALTAYGAFAQSTQFFFSYLYSLMFWMGLSLGCFLVTMIHQLAGGRWGYPTRRFLEAGFMVLPLMLVLFVPIFFGLHTLYPWARPEEVAADKTLQGRHAYDNGPAFIARALFFLGIWIWMAVLLRRWSLRQDATPDPAPTRKARTLSGPGIVIYGLLGTFAYVDWIMSLEKHWYSTMFAVIIIIGQILVAYAFSVVMLTIFRRQPPFLEVVSKSQYHQLGNLLLAFVIFWTYVEFSQLLIVYSGDEPHEIGWYLHRIAGSWKWIIAVLGLFHFFVPFFLLLFRTIKKNVVPITVLSAVLFITHIVAVYWLVMPAFHGDGLAVSWLDFTAPLGIGGLWVAYFLYHLKSTPILLQQDPGLQYAFRYEE